MTDRPSAPQPVAGWQPIETAPKDGSLFLCWVSAVRYGETDEGQQYQRDASQVDFCSWRDGPSDLLGHGYFDPCCGQIGDSQDVTHWMARPAPPGEQPPLYDQAALDAVRADERAFWLQAIAMAQQCIDAAYNDRWPEFDRLSDEFDDAMSEAIRAATPQEPT